MNDDFFAPPPFKVDEALVGLRRQLRDLRLAERGLSYDLKGLAIVELAALADAIEARIVARPARTPQWQRHELRQASDVRRFVDTVRQRLRQWSDDT